MSQTQLEYRNVAREDYGMMVPGSIRMVPENVKYQNRITGKVITVNADDIDEVFWLRMGNVNGLKIVTKDGLLHRFAGMPESDFTKIQSFVREHWRKNLVRQEQSIKGWNYGEAKVEGQTLVFRVDDKIAFEIPLTNVSQCPSGGQKSEVTLEFHRNEDAPVQLCEMRLHKPAGGDDGDTEEMVEQFRQAVMRYVEGETDLPIVTLKEILCATPRGRYDIKVYANRLAFHGKSYDYKIPFNTISRMFLLPHKDQRHVFFVLSIHPPIRQGQTRYPFIVLECLADDEASLELTGNDQQLDRLCTDSENRIIQGRLYEILSKIFRILTNVLITVPADMDRETMSCTVFSCAFRQASGYLYPLEKGFMYVHKPPMYVRFDEIDNIHFARSDASTRSFDFEIVQRSGNTITFSSIAKDDYNKLFDFVEKKKLKIRNAKRLDHRREDAFVGSDEELDPYKAQLKDDAASDDDGSDSEDEDFDVSREQKKQQEEKESSEGSGSEPDEEYDSAASDVSDDLMQSSKEKTKTEKPRKEKKEHNEKKESKGKRTKDKDGPKRASSAYIIWLTENRNNIKEDGMSMADVSKKAGQLWKEMSDADKQPYNVKAQKDKERYEREKAEYKVTHGESSGTKRPAKKKSSKMAETQSPAKKAISRDVIDDSDSDSSSAADEPVAKKSKSKETSEKKSNSKKQETDSEEADSDDESSD
ncbi:FACT complex subunit SSRP1 [Aphelenchoides besseyi]|nr:FACT complex subunit SSRP1 [Aphelenchoides besseyi]KAI6195283.1 FACT complex subunit SSRP1 [Aphelenchoides besseyi]